MAQTSYPTVQPIAFAGQIADSSQHDVLSRASEEAASFPYGVLVVAGTDAETQALLPTSAADFVLGAALHSHSNEVGDDNLNLVDPERVFNVLHEGRMYVLPEQAVAVGDPVYARIAAGAGGTQLGAFRMDADTASAQLLNGARWLSAGDASNPAILELDRSASF